MSKCCQNCKLLTDQLATAETHIGWLKGDKIRLNKSIKIRDNAMDSLIDLEKDKASKLSTAEKEVKRPRRWPDYFAWEREFKKVESKLSTATATIERLEDAMRKIQTAKIANMKPASVALYQMLIKETSEQALQETKGD